MYEAVRAHPDGRSTAARQARTAARYGYDGVVIRSRAATQPGETANSIDVVDAAEIRDSDADTARGTVETLRDSHTLLLLSGGTPSRNRYAVEEPRIDVLTRPTPGERDEVPFNHVHARAAARNGVRVELDLGPVLRCTGGNRVRAVRALRLVARLVRKYDTPHVVSANAASHLQLRAPRELVAVGERIGLEPAFVRDGLAEWGRLVARNRERASAAHVMPGVRITDETGEDR